MSEPVPPDPEGERPELRDRRGPLVCTIIGSGIFLLIFLTEHGREIFPEIIESLISGDMPNGEAGIIVFSLLMLAVVALVTPFVIRWVKLSRLLTNFLRVWAGILAACYWYFFIRYGNEAPEILIPLALSPTFTFIGLCLVRHAVPEGPDRE